MAVRQVEEWWSNSEEETVRLGEQFGRLSLIQGVVVCIRGELGAGKTHFIKGVAHSLGIDDREITSPTFGLAHEFDCPIAFTDPTKPQRLYHLDCYRFEKPEELLQLGIEDYLYPLRDATIIEWPERITSLLPPHFIDIHISVVSETERVLTITPTLRKETVFV